MAQIYHFDDVEIDLRGFRVLKAGKVVSLEPKALNLLVFLAENRGRLIEKKELLDTVWGDAFVTENVLTRSIAQLRKVLADDAKDARYIETVPTRGYRFVAELTVEDPVNARLAVPTPPPGVSPGPDVPPVSPVPPAGRMRYYAAGTVIALVCAAAIAMIVVWPRIGQQYIQIASNTQITTSAGLSFSPSPSPDTTQIAYSTDRGKGFEIFIRQLAPGGKEFQLTADGNENMQPAWSPDGSVIAYYSRKRDGIWVMPALGGSPRKLTDFGSHPSWSRDGQWVAFQSSALDDLGSDSEGINPPSNIWIIRSDGSEAKKITQTGQPNGGHGAPSWSPDSRHIVFVSAIRGTGELWSIGADGTGLVRMGVRSSGYFDPVYAHDGKSVLYGAVLAGQSFGLWQLPVSPDTSTPLGEPRQITSSGGVRIKNLALSSDGKALLYSAVGMTGSLQSLPVSKSFDAAGEPVALTSDVGCRDILPKFSPDGSRIAFISCHGKAGALQQLWLMNANGSDLQQLTSSAHSYVDPNWSPDGHRILVSSGGRLVSVDADTRQQQDILALDIPVGPYEVSPDGRQAAAGLMKDGIQNVWLIDIATRKARQVTFDQEDAGYPAWSPDGKWIAFQIARGPDNSIYIMPSAGGDAIQLTPYHGQRWHHDWSPDGDKILFAKSGDDLIWNIWTVSRTTKTENQLTHYLKSNAYVRYPTASPRGNQIVYEYTETTGNIWMMNLK